MTEHSLAADRRELDLGHTQAVLRAHDRMLRDPRLASRFVRLASGTSVHVVQTGQGAPLLMLHGSTTSSLSHVPLMTELSGVRAISVDRPGSGLSEPAVLEPLRAEAVRFVDEAADALRLDTFALAGASMGGTWALWYAMARPMRVRRVVILGAAPLLPGTRPPLPIRAMVAPLLGDVLGRLSPSPAIVVRLMRAMGEANTIVRYPDLLASLVAAAGDPAAQRANLRELRAIATPFGFRRHMRIRLDELESVKAPTLVVWGDRDPVGSVEIARAVVDSLPDARLEVLSAGHVPWLGHPERVATLVSALVR